MVVVFITEERFRPCHPSFEKEGRIIEVAFHSPLLPEEGWHGDKLIKKTISSTVPGWC
jgi:hypothetical protein